MSKKSPKRMTAAELMAQLGRDPEYQRRTREQERQLQQAVQRRLEEEGPIVEALAAAGIEVESVWDLVNTADPYPHAIPVLLEQLVRPYSEKVREGIARALAVPEAADAWDVLLHEFEQSPEDAGGGAKYGVGCALSVAARASGNRVDEVVHVLRNPNHGQARLALLDVLALSDDPAVRSKLEEFENDPVLGEQTRWHLKHPGRRRT